MPERWLNLVDAAEILNTTPEAIRMRAKRGSLESEKRPDGRLYVRIVADYTEGEQHLHGEKEADSALVEQLRSEVEYLRDENRRKDSIIMQMAQRIPELEAADGHGETYDASDEYHEESPQHHAPPEKGYAAPPETAAEPHSASEEQSEVKRSWWRRLFGG